MLKNLWCALMHRGEYLWKGKCYKCNPKVITDRDCLVLAEWAMSDEPHAIAETFHEECGDR